MLNIENMCGDHHAHTYGCHYAHLVDEEDDDDGGGVIREKDECV